MKKRLALVTCVITFFLTSCSIALPAKLSRQSASNVHNFAFHSTSLHKNMQVNVYLPPNYDDHKKYPVLYVFHGKDGNADTWMNSAGYTGSMRIDADATQLISAGKIRPLIIVSPEIDNSYGVNTSQATASVHGYSRGMYEDYIIKDLIPYIDAHYSTISTRDGRYVGGLSMGGFIALHDAFRHSDLFSKVGVMSAALWVGGPPAVLSWIYPTESTKQERDPITVAQHGVHHDLAIELIEGDSDPFLSANRFLYNTLQKSGATVAYHQYPGGHNDSFWKPHTTDLLLFFDPT